MILYYDPRFFGASALSLTGLQHAADTVRVVAGRDIPYFLETVNNDGQWREFHLVPIESLSVCGIYTYVNTYHSTILIIKAR